MVKLHTQYWHNKDQQAIKLCKSCKLCCKLHFTEPYVTVGTSQLAGFNIRDAYKMFVTKIYFFYSFTTPLLLNTQPSLTGFVIVIGNTKVWLALI